MSPNNSSIKTVISNTVIFAALVLLFSNATAQSPRQSSYPQFSGIYPHLAYYNNEGECGTGAVVPWADRLWVISYGPHLPFGSTDKLYEISPQLNKIIRPESIGGTPANRMIHRESNQLFIGPYAINGAGEVRTIPYTQAPGRYTGLARALDNPQNNLLLATMEEGFYKLDVHNLHTKLLYEDGNVKLKNANKTSNNSSSSLLPGAHGKGLYSGQGVMVYSNNGESGDKALKQFDIESGVLAEWNGQDWKLIRRNQFVEVTGPGGIYGNKNPATDPIWVTGWDHKSVLLGVRDAGKWTFFRLPKASHSYDGAHGWNTEWPRIRDVGTTGKPDYLMTMHGMFWHFPASFTSINSAGIRPRSAYLKVIGDFTRWQDGLVFGCDDSAQKEFLNKRKAKGNIEGPGQSNSNLWFTSVQLPDQLGPNTVQGAVWLSEKIEANVSSEPFLFAGWKKRMAWIQNAGKEDVKFTFEVDRHGKGKWENLRTVLVEAGKSTNISFQSTETGEWIKVKSDKNTTATVNFNYTDGTRFVTQSSPIFNGLASIRRDEYTGGLLYALGDNRRKLGVLAGDFSKEKFNEVGYYELDSAMNLNRREDGKMADFIRSKFEISKDAISVDEASVLVVDDAGRRWRLPKGNENYTKKNTAASMRICREVATERDLMNAHGTFYELPAENADGFAKIRPVASHSLSVHDYASYRGLLVMTGLEKESPTNEHIITSADGKAKVWAGTIDDLWKLGKPTGQGGPWKNTFVTANMKSDPYLIGFYDKKSLKISHKSKQTITFTIEIEPIGHGPWMVFKKVEIKPNETFEYTFASDFQARWIRFSSNKNCEATTWLTYQ
ncbi:hypothetical protein G9H61_10665 [Aquirufa ecclesiirivi]|uniref:Uncharacterized protein n=1 Tax=Aquirufa ecclesiirivi TaxID=2715124 RepID=A0ABT4JI01_9BACT|nr:hypothetical protein [Aquirufa ecclesiirivi]MCZ2475912.1 hypothetical protein [Aquirufa ecclesiirivi]